MWISAKRGKPDRLSLEHYSFSTTRPSRAFSASTARATGVSPPACAAAAPAAVCAPAAASVPARRSSLLNRHPRRRSQTLIAARLQLQETVLKTHDQIVGHHSLGRQAKHPLQVRPLRQTPMKVRSRRRLAAELGVVFLQIPLVEIAVRRLVIANAFEPHLLDQAILMRPVMTLHPAFGLRRRSGDDANVQLPAHASELCLGLDAFHASRDVGLRL